MSVQKIVKVLLTITILVIPTLLASHTHAAQYLRVKVQSFRDQITAQVDRPRTRIRPTSTPKPATTSQPTPISTNVPTANPTSISYSQQILELVNQERTKKSLPSLTIDPQLTSSAQTYAQRMAQQNFFSHTAPNGQTMQQRITQTGYTPYRWIAENIAAGQRTPQQVMTTWLNSSGHRANILNSKAQHIGVGYYYQSNSTYKYYWVQHFGAK